MCTTAIEILMHYGNERHPNVGVTVEVHDPYGNHRKFYVENPEGHALLERVTQATFEVINTDLRKRFEGVPLPVPADLPF
jgi:hypothetical protein